MYVLNRQLDVGAVVALASSVPSSSLLHFCAGQEKRHLPSAVLRWLKDGSHRGGQDTAVVALARAFGETLAETAASCGIDAVCRVLGSWEEYPSTCCPLEIAAAEAARHLRADLIHPFRRTSPRPPMSTQRHLSSGGALARRVRYSAQDLVYDGSFVGANVLVVDDIRCLGSSEAVLAWALLTLGGAHSVRAASMGQTAGLDPGHFVLSLDLDVLNARATSLMQGRRTDLRKAWLEPGRAVLHLAEFCPRMQGKPQVWWKGIAAGTRDCPYCTDQNEGSLHRLLAKILGR